MKCGYDEWGNDESAFNLHTGMIAFEIQHNITVEIDTLLLIRGQDFRLLQYSLFGSREKD